LIELILYVSLLQE